MASLHIVIDARRLHDFGVGTYIRSLAWALSAIDTTNRYTLVTGGEDARDLAGLPANFATALYSRPDDSHLDNVLFPMYLRGLAPDLVHVPLNRVPLLMIQPYVVTVHDLANLMFEWEEYSKLRIQLRRFRLKRGLERASRVIAVSEATRRDVARLAGVPLQRVQMVYNAPDPEFFAPDRPDAAEACSRTLERYQIRPPFLLYAGNIRRHKNIPRLVEAFAVVREQLAAHAVYRDLRLVIIGDNLSQYPAVRQAVIRARAEHAVRFLGFVPLETLRYFYRSCAAFVFPSRYEGFGLPPLEAMACGAPVVTSNVSSLPEVVGDAAILVNPENPFDIVRGIREALLDDALRATMIRRGHEQAAKFSWSRTAREVRDIYLEAAMGRTR
ncbi:MAG TPA: glycosyltransferase family 1 protein [Bryobacteraceae bacterium]|jgi:glycosyltransferase involved in cell wall biosynthesis|nr:glycosyltransferase family 1 protein [Bryobacteraceae bacterium]